MMKFIVRWFLGISVKVLLATMSAFYVAAVRSPNVDFRGPYKWRGLFWIWFTANLRDSSTRPCFEQRNTAIFGWLHTSGTQCASFSDAGKHDGWQSGGAMPEGPCQTIAAYMWHYSQMEEVQSNGTWEHL